MIIVLETSGKNEDVNHVKILLFENLTDALIYCEANTDTNKDKKYWRSAELVDENTEYELARHELYKT